MSQPASDSALYTLVSQFLALEAKLLDENRFEDWLALMDERIDYTVPIRVEDSRPDRADGEGRYRMRDNLFLLRKRVERMNTKEAWAENPASRTVRVVGSILVTPRAEASQFDVDSATMLYRHRAPDEVSDVIPVRRKDIISVIDGQCRLVSRIAFLPWIALRTPNLGVFL